MNERKRSATRITQPCQLLRAELCLSWIQLPKQTTAITENAFVSVTSLSTVAQTARKERQLSLLSDQEASIVAEFSTKGLDRNADTKSSGVEWLGDIPSSWQIEKLSWHFRAEKGRDAQLYTKEYCQEHPGPYPV